MNQLLNSYLSSQNHNSWEKNAKKKIYNLRDLSGFHYFSGLKNRFFLKN